MRAASFSAPLTMRMFGIWLPRWKCRSLKQSCMPCPLSSSSPRRISATVRPNFDREPPRLGAGLEAEAVFTAEIEHFLDHVALLVHLDRINAQVPPLVAVLVDGR